MNCVTYDFINKYFYCLSSSTFKTDTKKINRKNLGSLTWSQSINWWQQVKPKKPSLSTPPSTNIQRKQIIIYSLNTAHKQFSNTPGKIFRISEWKYSKSNTHQSTINRKGFNKELGGYFIQRKANNRCGQVWTPNRPPRHELPQSCRERKSACPIYIRPTDNLLTQPRTSLRINERLSDWWGKTGQ